MNPIISVQICRGIAAWLVVFHHIYTQKYADWNNGEYPFLWFFSNKGAFGVDLFFIISGFIMYITLSRKNYTAREFIIHRLLRIVPAYWVYTCIILILSKIFIDEFSFTSWNYKSLGLSLMFIPNENPSGLGWYPLLTVGWTLNFEIFFYCCLGTCIFFFNKHKFVVCSLVIFLLPLLHTNKILILNNYSRILNDKIIYEFVVGIFILIFSDTRKIWIFSAGFMILGFLFFETYLKQKNIKFFAILGDISYSTYLIHPILIGISKKYFIPNSMVEETLLLLGLIPLTFILSLISYQTIEKIPIRVFNYYCRNNR